MNTLIIYSATYAICMALLFGPVIPIVENPVFAAGTPSISTDSIQSHAIPVSAAQSDDEIISWSVVSSGGSVGTCSGYILNGTVSQTAVGTGSSADYNLICGFWQNFGQTFLCGDANGNGVVNIQDVTFLINFLYKGGPAPNPYESGDANGSGVINIQDITYLINYLYKGGPAPNCP